MYLLLEQGIHAWCGQNPLTPAAILHDRACSALPVPVTLPLPPPLLLLRLGQTLLQAAITIIMLQMSFSPFSTWWQFRFCSIGLVSFLLACCVPCNLKALSEYFYFNWKVWVLVIEENAWEKQVT